MSPKLTEFIFLWLFVVIGCLLPSVKGSIGDVSPEQQICVAKCEARNCSGIYNLKTFVKNQPWVEQTVFRWSCIDDCKYNCMWKTVDMFHKSGRNTPQFYGKWPFVRLLGIQEPAAALFSIFNLAAHLKWINIYRQQVPKSAPMYSVWMGYGLVSINAWIWSTVFHSRDVDFTEKMDYFSAFSIVTYSLMAFLIRYFGSWTWQSLLSAVLCLLIFVRHVFLMWFIKFDYGYNMKMNIGVGFLNSVFWFAWCFVHRKDRPHVRLAALAVFFLNLSMVLEILDFEPIFWSLDSHALWHLATSPIHAIWYKFVIADCLYLFDFKSSGRKLI